MRSPVLAHPPKFKQPDLLFLPALPPPRSSTHAHAQCHTHNTHAHTHNPNTQHTQHTGVNGRGPARRRRVPLTLVRVLRRGACALMGQGSSPACAGRKVAARGAAAVGSPERNTWGVRPPVLIFNFLVCIYARYTRRQAQTTMTKRAKTKRKRVQFTRVRARGALGHMHAGHRPGGGATGNGGRGGGAGSSKNGPSGN